jgi:hypothetical protein
MIKEEELTPQVENAKKDLVKEKMLKREMKEMKK